MTAKNWTSVLYMSTRKNCVPKQKKIIAHVLFKAWMSPLVRGEAEVTNGCRKNTLVWGIRAFGRWLFKGFGNSDDRKGVDRRGENRTPVGSLARLTLSDESYLVEIEDISKGGCALRLRNGLVPNPHHDVQVLFPGDARQHCTVRWTSGTSIGLEFDRPIAEFMDLVHLEHLGENYFRALIRIQTRH